MTRFLRSALGAQEPTFSQSIRQLEYAAGMPSTDIRLTSELAQRVRAKVAELGLDANDTTGPELFHILHQRLGRDESIVRERLGVAPDAPPQLVIARVQQYLQTLDIPKQCFAIKASVARKLLKAKPPKLAMKKLGYRSVESMLKHESPAQLYTAALLVETPGWHKAFRTQYAKLSPSDFETRSIALVCPQTTRWQKLATEFAQKMRNTVVGFRDLGTIVLLPAKDAIDGLAIVSLLLALEEMNSIRSYSSFMKLQQVKPTFGKIVQESADTEPLTSAKLAGQPVPWRMIQQYYATFRQAYHAHLFEPHVQPEDLEWHRGEEVLAQMEPRLQFWRDSAMLALMHGDEPVSMNVLDVALGYSNHLQFGDRIVHFFRDNLWHELMIRYLHQENLEAAVQQQLAYDLLADKPKQEIAL